MHTPTLSMSDVELLPFSVQRLFYHNIHCVTNTWFLSREKVCMLFPPHSCLLS